MVAANGAEPCPLQRFREFPRLQCAEPADAATQPGDSLVQVAGTAPKGRQCEPASGSENARDLSEHHFDAAEQVQRATAVDHVEAARLERQVHRVAVNENEILEACVAGPRSRAD